LKGLCGAGLDEALGLDTHRGQERMCMSYPISSFLSDAVATSLCSTHPRYR
jgi:hypothetical protein